MTKYTKRVITIIKIHAKTVANIEAKKTDTKGGELAWSVGLSQDGKEPATHYWNNWQMTPDEMAKLKKDLDDNIASENIQWFELDHWDPAIVKPTPDEVLNLSHPPLKQIEPETKLNAKD